MRGASSIILPVSFTGIDLSLSTSREDPQTGRPVPAPVVVDRGGHLSGQLQAVSAAWDKIFINVGSPKPGGRRLGITRPVRGTYDARTRTFALTWTSQIVGGPFNQFVALWHLSGRLAPDATFVAISSNVTPSAKTTTSIAPKSVNLFNCNRTSDGWSAGGVAVNQGTRTATYRITVAFTSTARRPLATASTTVTLRPGNNTLWSVQSTFAPPKHVDCVLTHVQAKVVGAP